MKASKTFTIDYDLIIKLDSLCKQRKTNASGIMNIALKEWLIKNTNQYIICQIHGRSLSNDGFCQACIDDAKLNVLTEQLTSK